MTDRIPEIYLRTDLVEELIDALEHSAELAERVAEDNRKWKWIIMAMHLALQGACSCRIGHSHTSSQHILAPSSRQKFREWFYSDNRESSPAPHRRLDSAKDLYERAQDARYADKPFSEKISNDIDILRDLRNRFSHFNPNGLSLEISGLPRVILNTCEVIEQLTPTDPSSAGHFDASQVIRIKEALSQIRASMALSRSS